MLIDMPDGKLIFRVGKEKEKFKVSNPIKLSTLEEFDPGDTPINNYHTAHLDKKKEGGVNSYFPTPTDGG